MKVIGISGSPRKGGNTEVLLQHTLKPFYENGWDVTEFYLSDKTIRPCIGCETCIETGRCAIQNDDMETLLSELETCDALIIGSPVYYRNVTAQLKALFDRSFVFRNKRLLEGKPGGAIAVGRGEGGGQSMVLSVIYNYYLSCGAICVPGEINGLSARADKPGDVANQPNRLRQAIILGENVRKYAELLRKKNDH
jgi:multimeric flavodoxin WrbA